ncbi:MAG TPA: hypothetical protein VD948_03475 [Rhodothermales bacterium]|nr:hypothetical protein [Rhodothermales bacterium]
MAQPVLLRDLLPAALSALRPVRVAPSDRAAHPPVPPRHEGLSQLLARVAHAEPKG